MATSLSKYRLTQTQISKTNVGASIDSNASSPKVINQYESSRPSKNKTTMIMSRTNYEDKEQHPNLPGISSGSKPATHREKQIAALSKRHHLREYKMPNQTTGTSGTVTLPIEHQSDVPVQEQ